MKGEEKKMIAYTTDNEDFIGSYRRMAGNSLQLENISESRPVSDYNDSKYGVKIWTINLIETYLPTLILGANRDSPFTEFEINRYRMNPWLYSYDRLKTTEYWFIILAINSYKSAFDFKDFIRPMLLPSTQQIDTLVTQLEREKELGLR